MHPGATSKSETERQSLTDRILTLCTSGRFGVREAVAEATRRKHVMGRTSGKAAWLPEDQRAELYSDLIGKPRNHRVATRGVGGIEVEKQVLESSSQRRKPGVLWPITAAYTDYLSQLSIAYTDYLSQLSILANRLVGTKTEGRTDENSAEQDPGRG